MTREKKIILFLIFIMLVYFAILLQNKRFYSGEGYIGIVPVEDDERDEYYLRGAWILEKKTPYKSSFQEYPQVAVYLFTIPHLINFPKYMESIAYPSKNLRKIFWCRQQGCLDMPASHFMPEILQYDNIFSGMMVVTYIALIFILAGIIGIIHGEYRQLLVLAFPAALWFSLNRFDVVPATLSLAGLLLLFKNKYGASFFFLALAVMTKGYPVIYLPLFLAYLYHNSLSRNWKALLPPTLVFIATIAIFCVSTIVWEGMPAFLKPYRFHASRIYNGESLFYFLHFNPANVNFAMTVFYALQFIFIPVVIAMGVKTKERLILSMGIVTLSFILFAKFHSPQWLLWASPLLLLNRGKGIFFLLIAYDIFTFLYCPLGTELAHRYIGTKVLADYVTRAFIALSIPIKIIILTWLFIQFRRIKCQVQ